MERECVNFLCFSDDVSWRKKCESSRNQKLRILSSTYLPVLHISNTFAWNPRKNSRVTSLKKRAESWLTFNSWRHGNSFISARFRRRWALSIQQKFRNFRWSNGTGPTACQSSRSRALQHMACWVKLCYVWKWRTFFSSVAASEQDDCETITCTISIATTM